MKVFFRYAVFHYRIVVACHIVGFSSKVGLSRLLLELSIPGAGATSASLPENEGLMLTVKFP
jgi:hypothetical protein